MITEFAKDIEKGKIGEKIFVEDFLEFLHINYQDVTGVQGYQIIDNDYLTQIGQYEIKANYHDDGKLFIEEYTNVNEKLGPISLGWFYKSKANIIVFLSKNTRTMVLVPFTDQFKAHYKSISKNYKLQYNKISWHNGRLWQSAFRIIPLSALNGYFAIYKKYQVKEVQQ